MKGAELSIRAATAADLDVLTEFALAMAHETEDLALDAATLRAGVAGLLADPARGRNLVLEVDGEVVASLMLTTEWSEWRNGFFWWIQSVYVRPSQRGQVSEQDIIAWCHDNMAVYKAPRVVQFVDALPKSGSGKVMWRLLQEAESR